MFECPISERVKEDADGRDFAQTQSGFTNVWMRHPALRESALVRIAGKSRRQVFVHFQPISSKGFAWLFRDSRYFSEAFARPAVDLG